LYSLIKYNKIGQGMGPPFFLKTYTILGLSWVEDNFIFSGRISHLATTRSLPSELFLLVPLSFRVSRRWSALLLPLLIEMTKTMTWPPILKENVEISQLTRGGLKNAPIRSANCPRMDLSLRCPLLDITKTKKCFTDLFWRKPFLLVSNYKRIPWQKKPTPS
jgi:hypothetical protein